jgi:hypothetical protein
MKTQKALTSIVMLVSCELWNMSSIPLVIMTKIKRRCCGHDHRRNGFTSMCFDQKLQDIHYDQWMVILLVHGEEKRQKALTSTVMLVSCELRYEINVCIFLNKSSMPSMIMTKIKWCCGHDHRGNETLIEEETHVFSLHAHNIYDILARA